VGVAALAIPCQAAHVPQRQVDFLMRYVEAGAGYIYTPITVPEGKAPKGVTKGAFKIAKAQAKGFAAREGLFTVAHIGVVVHPLESALEIIHNIKPKLPKDVPLIANIQGGGADLEDWVELAKVHEQAGVDMLELNMSCPVGLMRDISKKGIEHYTDIPPELSPEMEALGLTPILGDTPSAIGPIVKAVVEAVKIPVGVKPSPEAGFPRIVAIFKAIANNGGKFITNINNPFSIAPPNIYDGGKGIYPKFNDLNPLGVVIGPWNRYQTLKCLGVGITFVPEVDYAAVGGIVHPEHMIEIMMLGARHIGLSSAVFWDGVQALPKFIKFLENYMDKQGYADVDDFIGLGKQYIVPVDENTDFHSDTAVSRLDKSKCTQCGKCAPNICFALSKDEAGYPQANEADCIACGLCVAICPEGAFTIVDR